MSHQWHSIKPLFENQGNTAALPAWASCIEDSADGISEIRLSPIKGSIITHSSNTGSYDTCVTLLSCNTGVNPLSPPSLEIGDKSIQHLSLLCKESCLIEAASEIALVSGELQVDVTAINYLDTGNKAYPAWLDTVEGDADSISRLIFKPNGAGISTTPTTSHSLGVPLLQYARPYGSEHEAHLYLAHTT